MPVAHNPPVSGSVSPGQLFAYPFRIFFLSMAVLAVLAIPVWTLVATGSISLPLGLPGVLWHQHEMIFGFLSAAIAGFVLTAVCVWTGTRRTHGLPLAGLWGVWLAGRLLLAFGAAVPGWLVTAVSLAFLPLVILDAGWRIWRARQMRQLLLLLVLTLLWLMQAGFLLQQDPVYSHGALIMALALISIIGGRITPAFTRNWLRQRGEPDPGVSVRPALDMGTLLVMILLMAALVSNLTRSAGLLAIMAAVLMLIRLHLWRGWRARREPLLWILHLSILWVPVALTLLAGTLLLGWPASAWSHAAGTGAIGCLILGVAARVSLGHTGRPLVLPRGMVLAFVAIHLAALVRVATAAGLLPWHPGIGSSSLLWLLAFFLFLVRYSPILAAPRADGQEG